MERDFLNDSEKYQCGNYLDSTRFKCPTCGCDSIFSIDGPTSSYQNYNYAYKCYGNYSFSQEIIKVQKCPTCDRLRLFTPEGPLSHSEFLKMKKKVERIISEYK